MAESVTGSPRGERSRGRGKLARGRSDDQRRSSDSPKRCRRVFGGRKASSVWRRSSAVAREERDGRWIWLVHRSPICIPTRTRRWRWFRVRFASTEDVAIPSRMRRSPGAPPFLERAPVCPTARSYATMQAGTILHEPLDSRTLRVCSRKYARRSTLGTSRTRSLAADSSAAAADSGASQPRDSPPDERSTLRVPPSVFRCRSSGPRRARGESYAYGYRWARTGGGLLGQIPADVETNDEGPDSMAAHPPESGLAKTARSLAS
ncbi:hypothetical protein KM043_001337 [Ampulex compressa]|nr:hypothetical protein KM043_001337 [Ampulex compressa]